MGDRLDEHPEVRRVVGDVWHAIEHHDEVTSTNDVALERLRAGVPPGLVVVADHQTAGRGRAGRGWTDVAGPHGPGSLAVTATVPAPPASAELVPLAAGLAVLTAFGLQGATGAVKWPNDVLLAPPGGGAPTAKAAGILVERHRLPSSGDVLLVGCGLDLDWREVGRSGDAAAWTSLAESVGADVDRGRVLGELLRALDRWVGCLPDGAGDLVAAYRDACATIGRQIRAELPGGDTVEGVATDVDDAGRLVVERGSGQPATVSAGDVHHLT